MAQLWTMAKTPYHIKYPDAQNIDVVLMSDEDSGNHDTREVSYLVVRHIFRVSQTSTVLEPCGGICK